MFWAQYERRTWSCGEPVVVRSHVLLYRGRATWKDKFLILSARSMKAYMCGLLGSLLQKKCTIDVQLVVKLYLSHLFY